MRIRALAPLLALAAICAGCRVFSARELPSEPPPLAGMEEPLALQGEPEDEAERLALPPGGFTGVRVSDARRSLDDLLGEPAGGVLVASIVENSPGDAAGLAEGDLLLEVRKGGGEPLALDWPSQWRELELESAPGTRLSVLYDRAGVEGEAEIVVEARVRPAEREPLERLREEERVGVVVRGTSEVEARAAGLGPGAGAVVVGLSLDSPWRAAGLRFGDLITEVNARAVDHPQELLEEIRTAPEDASLALAYLRDGERRALEVRLSERASQVTHVEIPLFYSFERERDATTTSVLLGLLRIRRTKAAWDVRLLWLFSFGAGDSDRLEEVRT